MTTANNNSAPSAIRVVIEKVNEMSTNGIGESAETTYAIRDYSRVATKDNTPVRYITRVAQPENITAWLRANAHKGGMVRTINGATYFEIGHALGVYDKTINRCEFPLMPKRGYRKGIKGVSVARALSLYDNE